MVDRSTLKKGRKLKKGTDASRRGPRWRNALALCDTPAVLVAGTCLLAAGAAVSIASPTCWQEVDPVPTTCDRVLYGACPGTVITESACGDMQSADTGWGFTTYDHRTCTYQPQWWNEELQRCEDLGDPVTSEAIPCKGAQTPACPSSGGGPQ
jgi:hypothetical protein